jgi:hypothetical protein
MDETQLHTLQHMAAVMPFFILVFLIVAIIPYWFIWKKAGFSPWFSLLILVPIINIISIYVLAFSQWKVVPVNQSAAPYPYPYPPSSQPPQV